MKDEKDTNKKLKRENVEMSQKNGLMIRVAQNIILEVQSLKR